MVTVKEEEGGVCTNEPTSSSQVQLHARGSVVLVVTLQVPADTIVVFLTLVFSMMGWVARDLPFP